MQTQTMTGIYYTGMGNCFQTIYKEEGIRAFYRGVAAPMASYGLIKSITFGSYGNTCDRATTLPTRQPPSIPSSGPPLTTTEPQLALEPTTPHHHCAPTCHLQPGFYAQASHCQW